MQTLALISFLRAGSDHHSCCRRGPVFVLLGLPAATALDVERHGAAPHSILAMARTAATLTRPSAQLLPSGPASSATRIWIRKPREPKPAAETADR